MPRLYLYSNLLGSYVFDQKFYMIDKAMFKEADILKNSKALEEGRYIEAERGLIKKHSKGSFEFIGFKTEKIEGCEAVFDNEKFERISEGLGREKEIFSRLKEANDIVTRQKIRDSVNAEIFIMQAISSIKELEKILNMLAKRLREWYGYYLPEFSESIEDHEKFAEIIAKKDKSILLREIGVKKEHSMGADIRKEDLNEILGLAKSVLEMYKLKKSQTDYLERLMKENCPNMQAVAGTLIAAKLLGQAGSLKKLAEFPSSTIQVLGAEEAFFRHMKTGSKPPKYGFLHEHPFVARAGKESKGKIARALADKISIAVKVDYFKGEFIGDRLRKMVEAKLK